MTKENEIYKQINLIWDEICCKVDKVDYDSIYHKLHLSTVSNVIEKVTNKQHNDHICVVGIAGRIEKLFECSFYLGAKDGRISEYISLVTYERLNQLFNFHKKVMERFDSDLFKSLYNECDIIWDIVSITKKHLELKN